jgi:CopY/TcrY family copper transport repressor
MMTPTQISISEAEWEIMRVVWANKAVSSREVIDVLESKMDWKASTIKTLMGRLVDKEALETTKEGRKFIYTANINEEDTVKSYSEDILARVCNKDNGNVVKNLIKDATLSQADIEELMTLLNEKAIAAPEEVACECTVGQCDCHIA